MPHTPEPRDNAALLYTLTVLLAVIVVICDVFIWRP